MTARGSSTLPNWFIREMPALTTIERMVWVVLSNRAGTGGWNISVREIADQAGCSERAVFTALDVLERCCLIFRSRRGRATAHAKNRYRVADAKPPMPSADELKGLRAGLRNPAQRAVSTLGDAAPSAVSYESNVQSHTAPSAASDCTTYTRKETQGTQEMTPPGAASSTVVTGGENRTRPTAPAAPPRAPLPQPSEPLGLTYHPELADVYRNLVLLAGGRGWPEGTTFSNEGDVWEGIRHAFVAMRERLPHSCQSGMKLWMHDMPRWALLSDWARELLRAMCDPNDVIGAFAALIPADLLHDLPAVASSDRIELLAELRSVLGVEEFPTVTVEKVEAEIRSLEQLLLDQSSDAD